MSNSIETVIMELVVNAGNARSLAMEAIQSSKKKNFAEAILKMAESDLALEKAHKVQTGLIQAEAGGNKTEVTLLMVHAQDHLMNAMTVRDLAREFIALHEKI